MVSAPRDPKHIHFFFMPKYVAQEEADFPSSLWVLDKAAERQSLSLQVQRQWPLSWVFFPLLSLI